MAELEARAEEQGLDWKSRLSDLPDDKRLRAAALASLLKIDALRAIRDDTPLHVLDDEAGQIRAAIERGEAKGDASNA